MSALHSTTASSSHNSGSRSMPSHNSLLQLKPDEYTKHDLCFSKYFKAVNTFGRIVLYSTFIMIYQMLETVSGTMPIEEYCIQELKWSKGKYKNTFNASEREILSKDPSNTDFDGDITLLFKIIMSVLGDVVEPFKIDIRDLKNVRNTVCHEDIQMDEPALQQRFQYLKTLCRNILENAGNLTQIDISSKIHDIESGLDNLLVAKLESSDIGNYLQEIETFRQEKNSKMITEGRKEVMKVYSKLKILNPCSWLSDTKFKDFTVSKIFTTLKLAESGNDIPLTEILNVTSLKKRFTARVIILSGQMGAGKTSLTRYLLDEWCNRSSSVTGLSCVDIVVAIDMRTVSSESLVQYLREELLKSTSRLFNESDIIPVMQEVNVLFVIDGMDEATKRGRALVREIVNKFTNSNIIVTTRPEFTLELMQMAEDHIVICVEGFDKESQIEFVKKVFAAKFTDQTSQEHEIKEFLNYLWKTDKKIREYLTLPLTLVLMLILWCDDQLKPTTDTMTNTCLYKKIFEMNQQNLVSRLEAAGRGHAASLGRKVSRWLLELGKVAWEMMQEDVIIISQDRTNHLMDMCDQEDLDFIQTMSAFLNCEAKETLTTTSYSFYFHHNSAMEFLAAIYLSDRIQTNKSIGNVFDNIDSSRFKVMIMYVAGILKMNGVMNTSIASQIKYTMVFNMGVPPSDCNTWWRLLKETDKDLSISQVLGSVINQIDSWVINSSDCPEATDAKVNLLQHTGAAPAEVIINVQYTTTFEECSEIQKILKLVAAGEKSKVRVFLDQQFNTLQDKEVPDPHIVPLLQTNCLIEYKGHVGDFFTSELVHATNLETLYIRVSSINALICLCKSLTKHRPLKVKFMPSRGWKLKYLELLLDLQTGADLSKIKKLHFNKTLVVKIPGIIDSSAVWAGELLRRLSDHYTSVILQSSELTLSGMKCLLHTTERVNIKLVNVMTTQPATQTDVWKLTKTTGAKIGWGGR